MQVIADNHRRLKQVPLRVGVLCTIGPARLARALAAFRGEAPGVELEISVATQAEILRRLEEAEVEGAAEEGLDLVRLAGLRLDPNQERAGHGRDVGGRHESLLFGRRTARRAS
ncbi:LysR substrate-binding domain-containing protein [Sorangium sp. So ce1128]